VRYELEKKWLYIAKKQAADSFFVGYMEQSFETKDFISDNQRITKNNNIILERKPMPSGFQFYVPSDRVEDLIAEMTETKKDQISYHASIFGTPLMPSPTNPCYQCERCYKYGHFRKYCQAPVPIEIHQSLEMVRKPLPAGIPLNRFKVVKSLEEAELYNNKKSNIFYVDKKDNEQIYYIEQEHDGCLV
jgi:hypothetical protein